MDVEGSDCLCIPFEVVGDLAWGDHGEGVLRLVVGDREKRAVVRVVAAASCALSFTSNAIEALASLWSAAGTLVRSMWSPKAALIMSSYSAWVFMRQVPMFI